MPRLLALLAVLAGLGLPFWLTGGSESPHAEAESIAGEVRDDSGPVAGATVRIKGRPESVLTDEQGRFQLRVTRGDGRITASKDGYVVAGSSIHANPLVLHLRKPNGEDCERYEWVDPTPDPKRPMNCGNCHGAIHDEWIASGHAHSATNRRLINLYEGTDWHGRPGVGWSLLNEHKDGADVCSSCHAPTQRPGGFGNFDMREAAKLPVGLSGVHCDFCHKIRGPGDGEFGLTHGRYQLSLLRSDPADGHQLFFGPLDDVDRGEDLHSKFQRDSRLCAACHEGVVFGVPVYTTYTEWQKSPAGKAGISCQGCHMAPTGKMTNIAPGKGGMRRDPLTLGNHRFFDGSRVDMLRRSLKLEATARRSSDGVTLNITLVADGVGHRVPTGFIDRQVILTVEAFAAAQLAELINGPMLPAVLGSESGKPGRLYAKWLTDDAGRSPAPFWRGDPGTLKDTRLVPGAADQQEYRFPVATDGIRVRLVHRRFWKEVADQKSWPADEQLILEREIALP
jgi:hypothetical protein